jgi:hypothetical protein
VLVPLDYTGGTPPAHGHPGGQGGTGAIESGGFAGEGLGGTFGEAGMESEGGQADAPSSEGGMGNEGDIGGTTGGTQPAVGGTGGVNSAGTGGTAGGIVGSTGGDSATGGTGDVGGGAMGGTDATGGMDTGGLGGLTNGGRGGAGGRGGRGGRGGMGGMQQGGMSGTGVAGNADCPDADLNTDPANCGSCGHACDDGIVCENAVCVTTPCAGLMCVNAPIPMPTVSGQGYRVDNMGTADLCYEVLGYVDAVAPKKPSLIAWNCDAPRKLEVNGVTVPQTSDPGYELTMPERAGGFCVHATAASTGNNAFAGLKLPLPGELP